MYLSSIFTNQILFIKDTCTIPFQEQEKEIHKVYLVQGSTLLNAPEINRIISKEHSK